MPLYKLDSFPAVLGLKVPRSPSRSPSRFWPQLQRLWPRSATAALIVLTLGAARLFPSATADPIQLRPGQALQANGADLDPGDQSIPCLADWNGDGLLDLIVGYRYADKIAFYENVGDPQQPVYASFTHIQAGGVDIYHLGSGCGAPAPWVCDYDADGKRDLLVGTGAEGHVYFYRNINTDAAPVLTGGVQLLISGNVLTVFSRATPYVCDWDTDGRNDLLCGDGSGYVHFFKNVGSPQSPIYISDAVLQAGGSTVDFGSRSALRVCDWDGDGLKDLLGSASNNAGWHKNMGSESSPLLAAQQPLQVPALGGAMADINTGSRMRLEVADWNQDGVLDLLIGNFDGHIYYYEGYHFALSGIIARPDQTVALQWNSAEFLNYDILAGPTPEHIATPLATGLPSAGNLTGWTNPTPAAVQFYRILIAE